MGPGKRRLLLAAALLATLAAAWQLSREPALEEEAAPARAAPGASARRSAPPAALPAIPRPEQLARPAFSEAGNAFPSKSWQPPPPPPAPAAPPPPPAAPPLPFVYVGKLIEAGQVRVFLSDGARQVTARRGDVLNGSYRVESITDDRVEFTYLPLQQKQTLTIRTSP